jgi:hypothetical protein
VPPGIRLNKRGNRPFDRLPLSRLKTRCPLGAYGFESRPRHTREFDFPSPVTVACSSAVSQTAEEYARA